MSCFSLASPSAHKLDHSVCTASQNYYASAPRKSRECTPPKVVLLPCGYSGAQGKMAAQLSMVTIVTWLVSELSGNTMCIYQLMCTFYAALARTNLSSIRLLHLVTK